LQSCSTSFHCSSGPARTIPFLPGLAKDCVQIPDEPGSAEFVQDEPPERLELVFRECGLCDQQHAVKPRVDQGKNDFLSAWRQPFRIRVHVQFLTIPSCDCL
jgi:hypothetical protein